MIRHEPGAAGLGSFRLNYRIMNLKMNRGESWGYGLGSWTVEPGCTTWALDF